MFIPAPSIQREILKHLKHSDRVFFVQVGSNDGLQGDPIHDLVIGHPKWKGLFVEPVPYLFKRLKCTYNNSDRFIFENTAISEKKGVAKFYYVSEEAKAEMGDDWVFWYDQLGSFSRSHILKHANGKLEPYIIEEQIDTTALQDVFDRNDINDINLLHIDTEGHDYKVLSQIDFSRYKPRVVLYEHKHLSDREKESAEKLLKENNYKCVNFGKDTFARMTRPH